MAVRSSIDTRVSSASSVGPTSTATLGVEGTAIDVRTYPKGTRFMAVFNLGTMAEGTLTPSIVDCDTSGGTYTPVASLPSNALVAVPFGDSPKVQSQAFLPNPARPFIKCKLVETVSVTTAVGVHCYFVAIPADRV